MLNKKSLLLTGGTGSFGKAFIKNILKEYKQIERLIIFSRDELKQLNLSKLYPQSKYPFFRFFLGDVRDKERLSRAMQGVDYVVHAAALKQVDTAEYNPDEFIKTNVWGSMNVVDACLENNIKRVVALSTDKACSPANLYGATKLCSEKIFLAANNIKGKKKIVFSVVRYGNVAGSRGSIIPMILESKKKNMKTFNLTHKDATRFWITLDESVEMVMWALKKSIAGKLIIPKIPAFRVIDLLKILHPTCKIKITGLRPGEKIHEDLVSINETNVFDEGKYISIYPSYSANSFIASKKNKKMNDNFYMRSSDFDKKLDYEDLKIRVLNVVKEISFSI